MSEERSSSILNYGCDILRMFGRCALLLSGIVCFTSSVRGDAQASSDPIELSEANREEISSDQGTGEKVYYVKKKVASFIHRIEPLEDYQVEPLANELEQFFIGYERLLDARMQERSNFQENPRLNRKALEEIDSQFVSLRNETNKAAKDILDSKQYKRFRKLITEVAKPPGQSRGNRSGNRRYRMPSDDGWLRDSGND